MIEKAMAVNYTTPQLRSLVEEYIMQQKSSLSLKGACDYVLYGRARFCCRSI